MPGTARSPEDMLGPPVVFQYHTADKCLQLARIKAEKMITKHVSLACCVCY
jgi:hypothetical protein